MTKHHSEWQCILETIKKKSPPFEYNPITPIEFKMLSGNDIVRSYRFYKSEDEIRSNTNIL